MRRDRGWEVGRWVAGGRGAGGHLGVLAGAFTPGVELGGVKGLQGRRDSRTGDTHCACCLCHPTARVLLSFTRNTYRR